MDRFWGLVFSLGTVTAVQIQPKGGMDIPGGINHIGLMLPPPLPLSDSYSARGGGQIGWLNASWPMVGLQVSRNELVITTSFFGLFQLGRYTFVPSQVTAITRYGVIPFFGEGVQIQHTVAEYPRKIVFQYRTKSVLEGMPARASRRRHRRRHGRRRRRSADRLIAGSRWRLWW
ncbi:MAG: hypothetical protein JWO08_2861 [Verrucomicrobiaceae bacterium]|nr:hypothetical protein [Verrucomicrobiaceae bacterium]